MCGEDRLTAPASGERRAALVSITREQRSPIEVLCLLISVAFQPLTVISMGGLQIIVSFHSPTICLFVALTGPSAPHRNLALIIFAAIGSVSAMLFLVLPSSPLAAVLANRRERRFWGICGGADVIHGETLGSTFALRLAIAVVEFGGRSMAPRMWSLQLRKCLFLRCIWECIRRLPRLCASVPCRTHPSRWTKDDGDALFFNYRQGL